MTVAYNCADEEGGSGLRSCTGTLADGATLDTSALGSYSFTVDAEDIVGNTASVTYNYTVEATPPSATADSYTIDFETAPTNRLLHMVKVGRGMVYQGLGSANTNGIVVNGRRFIEGKTLPGNQARVITTGDDKELTVVKAGTTTPNPRGGYVEFILPTSYGGPGKGGMNGLVTLKSLSVTINNVSTSGSVTLCGNGICRKSIPLNKAATQTVTLDEVAVGLIRVSVRDFFSVDDISFEVPASSN